MESKEEKEPTDGNEKITIIERYFFRLLLKSNHQIVGKMYWA